MSLTSRFLLIFWAGMNILQFVLFAYDKRMAISQQSRIPEKWLWRIAWMGGAFGAWIAMEVLRHKTQHKAFVVGMPWLSLVQIAVLTTIVGRFFL
ncbi:hypothetical protein SDC9_135088 [bioreactor metagenome]|uniref:DUF1294 domain-containing protein n=1 Tax=bioreactor metagenome TaxID=1076179 RepID=A0A645DFE5_9ZZZZ